MSKKSVIPKVSGMYSCIDMEGINVRGKGIKEIIAKSLALSFVEAKAVNQVLLGFIKNLNSHLARFRILFFASVQSWNRETPEWIRCSLACRMSACQEGDGIS